MGSEKPTDHLFPYILSFYKRRLDLEKEAGLATNNGDFDKSVKSAQLAEDLIRLSASLIAPPKKTDTPDDNS